MMENIPIYKNFNFKTGQELFNITATIINFRRKTHLIAKKFWDRTIKDYI